MKLIMTSLEQQSKFRRGVTVVLLALTILSLSACGGAKKITTKDKSTDYKSAVALPPLKKPSRVVSASPQVPVRQASTSVAAPLVGDPLAPVLSAPAPVAQAPVAANTDTSAPITAIVVEVSPGIVQLQISASFDQAWDYLSNKLQQSDITVFSRNKSAGRFSVGCSSIDSAPSVVKSGRWSFFNRDKQEDLEYCALQAIEKRGVTNLSVLNRTGAEVSAEFSNKVLARILNN